MEVSKIFKMAFDRVYPLYIQKVERKGRTKAELDEVIAWLTGYDSSGLEKQLSNKVDLETFFAEAPALNPDRDRITGLICGVRVETVEPALMREIRRLDKLVDELAKGRKMEKIFRTVLK